MTQHPLLLKRLRQLLKLLPPLPSLKRLRLLLHQLLLLWKHQRLCPRQLLKHQVTLHHAVSFRVHALRRQLQRDPFLPTVHLLWHVRQAHCHRACRQVCHRV